MNPTPTPSFDFNKLGQTVQQAAAMNQGLLDRMGWFWYIVGAVMGALVFCILFYGSARGGAEVGLAGNSPARAKAGFRTFAFSLAGAAIVGGGTMIAVVIVGIVYTSIFK